MMELKFPANNSYVALSRLIVSGLARMEGLSHDEVYDLRLAVSEVVSNLLFSGATKEISLSSSTNTNEMVINIQGTGNYNSDGLFEKGIITEDMLKLLVDKITIDNQGDAVDITLIKGLNA